MKNDRLYLSLQESNSLKGIALILLLIHHLFYIKNGQFDDINIAGHGIVNSLGILCKVCVAIFVFLSGYGLGLGIQENSRINLKEFYLRRFTKLFLNYWFIWLLFVPIGVFFFNRGFEDVYGTGKEGWLLGILDFFGLINTTGKYGYNPTWWFYSCIILLYLIFPLIAYFISIKRKTIWIFLLISIMIIKIPLSFISPIKSYMLPFVLGIVFANKLSHNILLPSTHKKIISNDTSTSQQNETSLHYKKYYKIILRIFSGTLGVGGCLVIFLLLISVCILRLTLPYAFLWDSLVTLLIVLLYKSMQRLLNDHGVLEFVGKHVTVQLPNLADSQA